MGSCKNWKFLLFVEDERERERERWSGATNDDKCIHACMCMYNMQFGWHTPSGIYCFCLFKGVRSHLMSFGTFWARVVADVLSGQDFQDFSDDSNKCSSAKWAC